MPRKMRKPSSNASLVNLVITSAEAQVLLTLAAKKMRLKMPVILSLHFVLGLARRWQLVTKLIDNFNESLNDSLEEDPED